MLEASTQDIWQDFQKLLHEDDPVYEYESIALDVFDTFNIPYEGTAGGKLVNVDLKRVDPLSVIKASLLEDYVDSDRLHEFYVNSDGVVEFYYVGKNRSSFTPYYTIESRHYTDSRVSVMVTGAKKRQERVLNEWIPLLENATVFDTESLNSDCLISNFSTHAVIVYPDRLNSSPNSNWNNGIKDLFEPSSPHERCIGFSWSIDPGEVHSDTKIFQQNQSSVPFLVSDTGYIGKPVRRTFTTLDSPGSDCHFVDQDSPDGGTPVKINLEEALTGDLIYTNVRGQQVSKFLGVQGVFVKGYLINNCYGVAAPGTQDKHTAENTLLFVSSDNTIPSLFRLTEGVDYVLVYERDEEGKVAKIPSIQFANNLRVGDLATVGSDVTFYVSPDSTDFLDAIGIEDGYVGKGNILPLENGCAVYVTQVWAQINIDSPCFVVVDPVGDATMIAQQLKASVMPLSLIDEPAPIAFNGELLDQDEIIPDNDPTTTQDFEKTDYQKKLEQASVGRSLNITMSSLDEEGVVKLSRNLYNLLRRDEGVIRTHTCSPEIEPRIGDRGPGGDIINSIEYSYTDQGTYLITITEGPEALGDFAGIDSGIYYKQTENVSTKGTVIQDYGNHVQYLVRVDGYGDIMCINGSGNIVTIRDRVSLTIYNNAVED